MGLLFYYFMCFSSVKCHGIRSFLSLASITRNKTSYWSLTVPDLCSCKYTNTRLHVNPNHKVLDAHLTRKQVQVLTHTHPPVPGATWHLRGTSRVSSPTLRLPWRGLLVRDFVIAFPLPSPQVRKGHLDTLARWLFVGKWCLNLRNPHPKQLCKTYTRFATYEQKQCPHLCTCI